MTRKAEIPQGWEVTTFASAVISEKGRKPGDLGPRNASRSIPYVNIRAFERGVVEEYCDPLDRIVKCAPGDALIVWDGARSGLVGKALEGAVGSTLARLHSDIFETDYLRLFLSTKFGELNTRTKGVGIPHLDPRVIGELLIPVAPLAEQRRIVKAIETRFTRLDAAFGALERARTNLKRYRASILEAACDGRLTSGVAALGQRSSPPSTRGSALPSDWNRSTLEQLNPVGRQCAYGILQPGPDVPGGVPIVRVQDIREGRVDLSNLKRVKRRIAAAYPRTRLKGGEVLISLVGAIGRTAVAPPELAGANTARAVGVIPIRASIEPKWVEFSLRRPSMVARLTSLAHEVARKTLNLEDVRATSVSVPPRETQRSLIDDVDRCFSIADKVDAEVEDGLEGCNRLRDAILSRAFEGRLVPQDPSDEPARVLLERIRAATRTISKPARGAKRLLAAE